MGTAVGSDLFWLYVVNIALGAVTLLCVGALTVAVIREVRHRRRAAGIDDHTFDLPELGATMADGGKRIDQPSPPTDESKPR
jgi:hypothetical protein